jgi:hypothetical protein
MMGYFESWMKTVSHSRGPCMKPASSFGHAKHHRLNAANKRLQPTRTRNLLGPEYVTIQCAGRRG